MEKIAMNMLLVNTASEFSGQLRLLTIVVCVGFFMRLTADETPTVVYAVVNETARLSCPLPLVAPPRVQWFDLVYNTDRRPRRIFSGSGAEERSVDSKHPNGAMYDVDDNFTLFISAVKLDDAGTYFCTSRQANYTLAKTYYLAVAGFPICRGTNPIAAGQSGQYSCESAFSGNYRPSLEWRREPNNSHLPSADDFNVRLAKQVLAFNASESDDGTLFTCRISFGSVDEQCAINLTVFYPARNVVIEPIKKSFSVGEEIRCSADGKPAPEITFEPVLSRGRTGLGWGSVTIPKSLGGRKTSVDCIASNVIDGKRLIDRRSFEFSVENHSSVNEAEDGNNGNPAQSKSSSTTGAIVAGIVVGIMILIILVGIVFCIRLRRKRKPAKEENGGSKTSSSARAEPKTPIKENQV